MSVSAVTRSRSGAELANLWRVASSPRWRLLHAICLEVANTGDRADRLARVATRVAKRVTIVDREGKEGGGLTIPGSAEFVIGRGALRIELVGLKRRLNAHGRCHLLLVFAHAGKARIEGGRRPSPSRPVPCAAGSDREGACLLAREQRKNAVLLGELRERLGRSNW